MTPCGSRVARPLGKRETARILIDEEGEQTEIRVYPKEQVTVRLVVSDYGEEADEKVIDGMVGAARGRSPVLHGASIAGQGPGTVQTRDGSFTSIRGRMAQPPFSSEAVEAFLGGVRHR